MAPKKSPATFEETLAEIETLTNRLEDDDTPLEQSLKDFEKGVQLIRQAQKALLEAQQNVKMLLDQNGEPDSVPFAEAATGSDPETE